MTGEETFHPDTRALLDYARVLRSGVPRPVRANADRLTGRLFLFDCSRGPSMRIQAFGADLVALFGRDLKGESFLELWPSSDAPLLNGFVAAVGVADAPGVARAVAATDVGARVGVEILLTPLHDDLGGSRRLGLFQPLGGESFLAGRPIASLKLETLFAPPARQNRSLRLVVSR